MTRATMTMLGAILGVIQGFVFFLMLNFSPEAPLHVFSSGDWIEYPPLIFSAVGALVGAGLGWAVFARSETSRMYVSVPNRPSKAGDPPYNGLFG